MNEFPGAEGYRMPAEWHCHAATQLQWPSNRETWPGDRLERVEEVFLQIIEVLHRYEPVLLFADPCVIRHAEQRLKERSLVRSGIHLIEQKLNDVWARDCGPLFIHRRLDGKDHYKITDWQFNAWGGKYLPYVDDNRLPSVISERFSIPRTEVDMVLEGGAIETNGEGTLITTESVLLHPNRNPHLDKSGIEKKLHDYLGADEVIWLKAGLAGDDTDGHVDGLCRFLNRNTVMTVMPESSDDINFPVMQENLELLKLSAETRPESLQIEILPMPETRIEGVTADGSEHVPASYANFYIANGVVLLPLYDENYDDQAAELLTRYFPGRDIAGIPSSDLVWGQGGIHCVTQPLYGPIHF